MILDFNKGDIVEVRVYGVWERALLVKIISKECYLVRLEQTGEYTAKPKTLIREVGN